MDDVSSSFSPDSDEREECIVRRIPEMRSFLGRRGFHPWVVERAIDRVMRAALPYINGEKVCQLTDAESRRKWLFGALLKAAKQIASRDFACKLLEPCKLRDSVQSIRASVRAFRSSDESNPLISALHAALDTLTEKQWDSLNYCIVWEMTYQEAAHVMESKPKTVEYHLNKALRKLRKLLVQSISDDVSENGSSVH